MVVLYQVALDFFHNSYKHGYDLWPLCLLETNPFLPNTYILGTETSEKIAYTLGHEFILLVPFESHS